MCSVCVRFVFYVWLFFFFFKQKTAYEMRISDWSSDVCSSDLSCGGFRRGGVGGLAAADLPQPVLKTDPVKAVERKRREQRDAVGEHAIGVAEGGVALRLRPFDGCGVRNAAVRRHRMPRAARAPLVHTLVADGKDQTKQRP